jgi:hypothetical protein
MSRNTQSLQEFRSRPYKRKAKNEVENSLYGRQLKKVVGSSEIPRRGQKYEYPCLDCGNIFTRNNNRTNHRRICLGRCIHCTEKHIPCKVAPSSHICQRCIESGQPCKWAIA